MRKISSRSPAFAVRLLGLALATLAVAGIARREPPSAAAAGPPASPVHFVDITRSSGIKFVHNTGAFGKKYLPETMGAGC
ncbi:MAG TPA: hypothetical protein VKU44_07180, partial [Terriglobia bacterium]|nr:hypothetical protein [Terriglobia bacterium]